MTERYEDLSYRTGAPSKADADAVHVGYAHEVIPVLDAAGAIFERDERPTRAARRMLMHVCEQLNPFRGRNGKLQTIVPGSIGGNQSQVEWIEILGVLDETQGTVVTVRVTPRQTRDSVRVGLLVPPAGSHGWWVASLEVIKAQVAGVADAARTE
jgi:hypothetical protein